MKNNVVKGTNRCNKLNRIQFWTLLVTFYHTAIITIRVVNALLKKSQIQY